MLLDRPHSVAMQLLIWTQLRNGTAVHQPNGRPGSFPVQSIAKLKCWHANCVSAMALAARDAAAEWVHASAEHVCQEELEVLTKAYDQARTRGEIDR